VPKVLRGRVQDADLVIGDALDRVEDALALVDVAFGQAAGAVLPGDDGPVTSIRDQRDVRDRRIGG
jgi:hypothetical protein